MHISAALLSAAFTLASASPVSRRDAAIRDSPSGTYAPVIGTCPLSGVSIRQGSGIDPREAAYIQAKTVTSLGDWTSYLENVGLEGLDVSQFVPSAEDAVAGQNVPIVSFAVSGGGQRAMLVGGGILAAFDGRNATTVAAKSGGVLQLAQYLSGLSGGSWMTGSWATSNFPSFEELRDDVWVMTENYFAPSTRQPQQDADAAASIGLKQAAGAPVSAIDAYGRILAYHLVNDSQALSANAITSGPGAATLWSSIQDTPLFKSKMAPFPIIISTARVTGNFSVTLENPIYESTPYHFGTNVPSSGGLFVPIEYLGTEFAGGALSSTQCMTGFDNAGFLMGCSGNILGAPVSLGVDAVNASAINDSQQIKEALGAVPDQMLDNGRVVNPFRGLASTTGFPATDDAELALIDGGFGGENVPYFPIIQPSRAIDVIISIDASANPGNFPNGMAPFLTYQKTLQPGYEGTPFPVIPNIEAFVAQGLNKRPVFFGSSCYEQPKNVTTPLIVYVPNYNIVFPTNTSTGSNSYTVEQTYGFFDNGFAIATQSGSATWSSCLACALVDTQVARNGASRTSQCESCFSEYCYMGAQ